MKGVSVLISVFLVFITSGCTSSDVPNLTGLQDTIFPTESDLQSFGLYIGDWGYQLDQNLPSEGMLYSDYDNVQYAVTLQPDEVKNYMLSVGSYSFDSVENRDELYSRWRQNYEILTQWETAIEENTYGERSYFVKSYDNYVLFFAKGDRIIWIEGETEIGEDRIRSVGNIIENKI